MAKTLQQILGYQNLTGLIQNPIGGVPADVLPPEFFSITKPIEGNSGTYTKVQGNRQTAKIAAYGSPSQRRELKGVSEIPVVLLHSVENFQHPVAVLEGLRNFENPQVQQRGMEIVGNQTGQFKSLFNNLRLGAIYSALALGKIYFSAAGDLLPSSAGASLTVDFGVPANQLDNTGIGGWSTATTDIIGQLLTARNNIEKATGYSIEYASYGPNLVNLLLNNNGIAKLIQSNNSLQNSFLQNTIPDGFLEMKWRPARRAWYEDANGTMQSFFGDNTLSMYPTPDRTWYEVLEGSYPVPRTIDIVADAMQAAAQFDKAYGQFSYAQVSVDPPGIKQVAGDTFLPAIKVPGAIRIVRDVTQAAA